MSNHFGALLAVGDWDAADRVSAAALRANTANRPHHALISRAEIEIGRGDFEAARAPTSKPRSPPCARTSAACCATTPSPSSWPCGKAAGRTPPRPCARACARARSRDAALYRVQLSAHGLRAQAELATLARVGGDAGPLRGHLARARGLLTAARRAAEEAAAVTPNAGGWRALAEAEYARARGDASPDAWSEAAAAWERLERPPHRGVLPLATGRGARRRRRRPERPVARGPRRGGADRGPTAAARAGAARRARAARS